MNDLRKSLDCFTSRSIGAGYLVETARLGDELNNRVLAPTCINFGTNAHLLFDMQVAFRQYRPVRVPV